MILEIRSFQLVLRPDLRQKLHGSLKPLKFPDANDIYSEYVHIYTDGSKDPVSGKTGIAFYIEPSFNTKAIIYRARLSNNISVYTSELMAITQALKWILNTSAFCLFVFVSVTAPQLVWDGVYKGIVLLLLELVI